MRINGFIDFRSFAHQVQFTYRKIFNYKLFTTIINVLSFMEVKNIFNFIVMFYHHLPFNDVIRICSTPAVLFAVLWVLGNKCKSIGCDWSGKSQNLRFSFVAWFHFDNVESLLSYEHSWLNKLWKYYKLSVDTIILTICYVCVQVSIVY